MNYLINTPPFALVLTDKEYQECLELSSEGLVYISTGEMVSKDTRKHIFKVNYSGEGFDLDSISKYLKKSPVKKEMFVLIDDHKGSDKYIVEFGPGFCEEE